MMRKRRRVEGSYSIAMGLESSGVGLLSGLRLLDGGLVSKLVLWGFVFIAVVFKPNYHSSCSA